jgi:YD repeat-containing protein
MTLRADIATGETTLDRTDLRLGGTLPLVLMRQYRSGAPAGLFGVGWRHGLDRTLRVAPDRVVYAEGSGRETVFAPVAVGMEARHPEGLTLQHHADGYVVFASPLAQDVFRKGRPGDVLRLERIVDPNGNRVKLSYAGERLTEIVGAAGQSIRFVYAGNRVGQITVTGADGRATAVRTFRYGPGDTLIAETDAVGRTTEYAYDRGLLVRAGAGSDVWLAQYDGDRRCIALWRADGTATHHLAYDPLRQTTRAVGTDGRQILFRHALGAAGSVVLERVDAEGERLNYYYDEAQRLIGHSDPGGTVVTFQRLDPETGERFQIDYEGRLANATLGANGLVESLESGAEGAFVLGYDERFNLVRLTTPLGADWAFARDRKGKLSAVVSPAGRRVDVRRDGATLAVEDGRGPRLRLTSDLFGRTVARTDGAGREQRFRYDPEGRLVGVEAGDGYRVTWTRDEAGHLLGVADSERREVRWSRDGVGRVLAVEKGAERVRFTYDLAERISAASGDAGEVRFGYDEQDRLRRVKGPRWMAFSYDEGQTTVRTAEQHRVFSALGEPIEVHEAEGGVLRFQYGPSGELVVAEREADGGATSLLLEYDPDGRLVRAERGVAAVDLGYDPDGLLTTVEGEGHAFAIDYDDRLQPAALRRDDATYRFTFDDGGRLTAWDGEGLRRTFRYDALDRCTAVRANDDEERKTTVGAVERMPAGEGLTWVVAPRGVALVADGMALPVALWGREEMRVAPLRLDARIVRALVFGLDAALAAELEGLGPPVERWRALARDTDIGPGVPRATPLGLPWPALDLFALARDGYDPHFARWLPGALPHHQPDRRRAPDEVLTGSHRAGVLQPRVWAERAHGPHLAPAAPLALPGGVTATLAYQLYRTLTRS